MNKLYTTLLAGSLLVGMAGAGHAALFSFNFSETDGIPLAFTYAPLTGTTYALTGSTSDISVLFAGAYTGSPTPETPYSATLTVSAVATSAIVANSQMELVSLTATFSNIGGVAGSYFTVTAGTATPSGTAPAGVLSAQSGASSGGFAGSTTAPPPGTALDDVLITSNVLSTTGWYDDNYSFTINLSPPNTFAYTTPTPPAIGYLLGFTTGLTGSVGATTPVPEPGSIALAMGALVSFGMLRCRRRK